VKQPFLNCPCKQGQGTKGILPFLIKIYLNLFSFDSAPLIPLLIFNKGRLGGVRITKETTPLNPPLLSQGGEQEEQPTLALPYFNSS